MGTPDSVLIRYLKTDKLFGLLRIFERSSSPEFTSPLKRIKKSDDERSWFSCGFSFPLQNYIKTAVFFFLIMF